MSCSTVCDRTSSPFAEICNFHISSTHFNNNVVLRGGNAQLFSNYLVHGGKQYRGTEVVDEK